MRRPWFAIAWLCVLASPLWLLPASKAVAGAAVSAAPARTAAITRRTPRMRPAVFERFAAVQRAAEGGDHAQALGMLESLSADFDGGRTLNSYERANLYYFRGFIRDARGEREAAVLAYRQVLTQQGLPLTMEVNTRYALAQLHLALGQWTQAADILVTWFAISDDPSPEAHVLLARARHEQGRNRDALKELDAAIAEARQRHLAPQEDWYLLMRTAAYADGDLKRTAVTLETLARDFPRKEYLLQLAAIEAELNQPARRVAAMEAAWLAGWLVDAQELLGMADLYLAVGLPVRAAALLEQELAAGRIAETPTNLALIATAWQQAREPALAIPRLEAAARLGKDAQLWMRLAGLQLDHEQPASAAESARAALALDGAAADGARVLLGRALYEMGRLREAREAFLLAQQEPASQATAAQWLRFLDTEIARRELL